MSDKIITFRTDTKHRKQWFTGVSFSHPAKMSLPLQIWLIENFTKEGETILDPMAGSGTIMVACSMGRHVICLELESKFCDMMKGNWERIKQRGPQMGYGMGECRILQGDSRNLEGLLADKCIFSPPYAEAMSGGGIAKVGHQDDPNLARRVYSAENMNIQRQRKRIKDGKAKMLRPDAIENETNIAAKGYFEGDYSKSPANIGNLPYGQVDKVITSPPYAEGKQFADSEFENKMRIDTNRLGAVRKYNPVAPNNLGNLPYGNIDKIITSPPYEGSIMPTEEDGGEKRKQRLAKAGFNTQNCGLARDIRAANSYSGFISGYANNSENIGNLKSTSYLEAMLQVYQSCFRVLKPQGLMILVTKNFIRQKQVIRLDLDTIKLCEQSGFVLIDQYKRKLTAQSFWRIIYQKKFPDVEQIGFEDVLIFQRL